MARFHTGGKHLAFWLLSQRFMPPIAIMIPVFLLYRNSKGWFGFSLVDTRLGLVLLYTVFALPFTVWMMYAYFRQMPPELEEAALVDGCSRMQALWKIAAPLAARASSRPAPSRSSSPGRSSSSRSSSRARTRSRSRSPSPGSSPASRATSTARPAR